MTIDDERNQQTLVQSYKHKYLSRNTLERVTHFDDVDDALLADLNSSRFFVAAGRQATEPVP
jgi:hypothetical protein